MTWRHDLSTGLFRRERSSRERARAANRNGVAIRSAHRRKERIALGEVAVGRHLMCSTFVDSLLEGVLVAREETFLLPVTSWRTISFDSCSVAVVPALFAWFCCALIIPFLLPPLPKKKKKAGGRDCTVQAIMRVVSSFRRPLPMDGGDAEGPCRSHRTWRVRSRTLGRPCCEIGGDGWRKPTTSCDTSQMPEQGWNHRRSTQWRDALGLDSCCAAQAFALSQNGQKWIWGKTGHP